MLKPKVSRRHEWGCGSHPEAGGVGTLRAIGRALRCLGIWAKLPTRLHGGCDLRAVGVNVDGGRGGRQRPRGVSRDDPGSWM